MAAVDGRATVFKVGMRPTIGHKKYVEHSHTTVVGLVSAAREFINYSKKISHNSIRLML